MNDKGFILTIDVILALVISSFLVVAMLFLLSQPKIPVDEYLYRIGLDVLAISEKDYSFNAAIDGNKSGLNEWFATMPNTICLNLTIYNNDSEIVYTNSSDCDTPVVYVLAWRSVVHAYGTDDTCATSSNGVDYYIASAGVWRE